MARADKSSNCAELPEGFAYQADFLSTEEEEHLIARIQKLEFHNFNFQGYVAKRRIVSYGFGYGFVSQRTNVTQSFPDFLIPLKAGNAIQGDAALEERLKQSPYFHQATKPTLHTIGDLIQPRRANSTIEG
jgi:hypothetical protein